MDEYIERKDAVDAVLDVYYDTPDIDLSGEKFEDAILKIPAADVVPVVRCKDCRYRGLICCPVMHETIGNGLVDYAVDNGYCWCGKQKED